MKTSHLGLAALLVVGLTLGTVAVRARERSYVVPPRPGTVPLSLVGEVPPGLVVRTYEVEGICCESCGGKLHDALAGIEGVRRIAMDPAKKEVQVLVTEEISAERLATALTFDKYVARPR